MPTSSKLAAAQSLATGYYLDNFHKLLDFVDDLYQEILTPEEHAFSRAFRDLPRAPRRLFVRLISRKGPLFRQDKLVYPEIGDIGSTARLLRDAGLLAIDEKVPVGLLLSLLTRPEIDQLTRELAGGPPEGFLPRNLRKPDLVAALEEQLPCEEITTRVRQRFSWIFPLKTEHLLTYRLLFFGNLSQDLTEFVLLDLGILEYEDYAIDKQDRLFQSREILESTLQYLQLRDLAHEAVELAEGTLLQEVCEHLPPTHGLPQLERRRSRILNLAGRFFERLKKNDEALCYFGESSLPPARERRARIFDRMGRTEEALALCGIILAGGGDGPEREFALQFRAKIEKKLGKPSIRRKPATHPVTKTMLQREPNGSVEQAVLNHYLALGRQGFYAENRFWLGMFGLAFWAVIFQPCRGAFFNRYQGGPRDLYQPEFSSARAEAVAALLEEIAGDPNWPGRMLTLYRQKLGIANYLVNWKAMASYPLEKVLQTVPGTHFAAIFGRLCRHVGEYKSGFPDLFFFLPGGAGYELAEVKGPGDQLQLNQKRWLRFFQGEGIPYRIERVTWERADVG